MIRIKNPTPPKIPVEYQELDYIESTGTQYIDTGVINVTGDVVDVSFQATSVPSAGETYIYAMYKSDTEKFRCGFNWGKFFTTGGFSYSQTGSLTAKTIGTGNCTVDTTLSAYLFSQHESAGAYHTANSKYKLYYCKIYRTNVLIRDFVPCYRKSDNEPGMYDLVNNVFYTNAGTGTFLMGSEVNVTKEDLNLNPIIGDKPLIRRYIGENLVYEKQKEYTKLEYIQSTGTQYIDTGIYPNGNTKIDFDFSYTTISNQTVALFGGGQAWKNNDFESYLSNVTNGRKIEVLYGSAYGQSGVTPTSGTKHNFIMDKNITYLDGTAINTFDNVLEFTSPATLYLFALHRTNQIETQTHNVKIYSCKIYDNDTLVRDYIPVIRNSDNVAGLLDKVNNVFYENKGTGTFLTGAVVS